MSHTDKTEPWYMWLYENPSRAREIHQCGVQQVYVLAEPGEEANRWGFRKDYRDYGPCTLPEFTPENIHRGGKCRWLFADHDGAIAALGRRVADESKLDNGKNPKYYRRSRENRNWRKDWDESDCQRPD